MRKCSNFGVIFKSPHMNKILIVAFAAILMMGCSTVYKSGQTPDDVYFSPAINNNGYVVMEENDEYRSENVPMNDRYLRMKSLGRKRWSSFDDDYGYWNDPRWNTSSYFNGYSPYTSNGFGYLSFNTPYLNPFNSLYYGQPYIIYNSNVKAVAYKQKSSGARIVNLNNYTPVRVSNYNPKTLTTSGGSNNSYINSGSSMPRGGYNPTNTSSSDGSPSRTFTNSSSGSSSSGSSNSSSSGTSSGSSSAPVRTFPRGGGN